MTWSDVGVAASIGASAAFYALGAAVAIVRRSPPVPTLPATSDLGPESPAVANLLAGGGTMTPDAVPATLFDLAARHCLQIVESAPDTYACRLGATAAIQPNAYESRVLDLLRQKASGGVVPAQALTTGPADEAKGWMKSFRGEVVAEATRLGVATARWPATAMIALGLLSFAAFLLAAWAANEESTTWPQGIAIAIAVTTFGAMTWAFRDDTQMITRTGVASQARWLALKRYLHDDELFASLPPTAVAVRDRYMAYGVALGVAAAAIRAIPMGAESDTWAWSHYSGRWRQVRVDYPRSWPPGWGRAPSESAWLGIRFGAFGLFWLWVSSIFLKSPSFGPQTDQLTKILELVMIPIALIALVVFAAGLWLVLGAIVTLFGTTHVTGEAIRLRRFGSDSNVSCYLAVYRGTEDRVRAWKVRPEIYAELTEYQVVTVSVTPLHGYVREVHAAAGPAPDVATASG